MEEAHYVKKIVKLEERLAKAGERSITDDDMLIFPSVMFTAIAGSILTAFTMSNNPSVVPLLISGASTLLGSYTTGRLLDSMFTFDTLFEKLYNMKDYAREEFGPQIFKKIEEEKAKREEKGRTL